MKKKFAVHGSYFGNNFGDTLLISLLCNYLSEKVGKENVYLAVKGVEKEQFLIGYPVINKKERLTATHLIFSGGGYFGEPKGSMLSRFKWSIRNYLRHIWWMNNYKYSKIGVFGLGFGPLKIKFFRYFSVNVLNKAETVVFRDIESLNYAKQYGFITDDKEVDVCVDMALSVPYFEEKEDLIILHVFGLSNFIIEEILFSLKQQNEFSNSYFKIVFDARVDKNFQKNRFVSLMGKFNLVNYDFEFYKDVNSTLKILKTSRLVVTNKLHVGILGIAYGAKVISIPKHQKTKRLYKQLNLQNFCIPVEEYSKDKLENALSELSNWYLDREFINSNTERLFYQIDRFIEK